MLNKVNNYINESEVPIKNPEVETQEIGVVSI